MSFAVLWRSVYFRVIAIHPDLLPVMTAPIDIYIRVCHRILEGTEPYNKETKY